MRRKPPADFPCTAATVSALSALQHCKRKAGGSRRSSATQRGVSVRVPDGSVLGKLSSRPSLEDVQAVLEEPGLQSVPVMDLLNMVAEKRRGDILLSIMQVLAKGQVQLDPRDYTVALSICSKLRIWQDACLILLAMPEANVYHFNATISACEKSGQWLPALALLKDMTKAKVQATVVSFSAAISSCEKGGQWQMGLALFQDMPKVKVQANIISFGAAISACEKGGQWQQALALFQEVPRAQLQATHITFSSTISACEKGGQWPQALSLFFNMLATKVQADQISFNASISACEKGGQWQQALALFQGMPKAKLRANDRSFNASISACEKGRQWQQALALFQTMPKAKVQADQISFSATISACEKGGQWQQALSLFLEMQLAELEPDQVSYNSLLDAVQGKPFAIGLFQKALRHGIFPKVAAARWNRIDLHDLSEGAAQLAVWWWLYVLVLPELSSSLHSGALCRCEVVTGYGKSRMDWHRSDIRAATMSLLQHLGISCRFRHGNFGSLELSFGERDLARLQQCFQNQPCPFILPACRVLILGQRTIQRVIFCAHLQTICFLLCFYLINANSQS